MNATTLSAPSSDVDLFSDVSLADPYPRYAELRQLGPVVFLEREGIYAATCYVSARQVLSDAGTYSSAQGVSINPTMNAEAAGRSIITTDPPLHQDLRRVLQRPLRPGALREVSANITIEAEQLVDRLVTQGAFDGVTEFATHLPVSIVSHLIGIPEDGREQMLEWANAVFDVAGPNNARGNAAGPVAGQLMEWALENVRPPKLSPNGWAQQMFDAGERGELPADWVQRLAFEYMFPSLDTTINATSALLMYLGTHPEQWRKLQECPELIPNAIAEAIRLETPIQYFTRVATTGADLGGVRINTGDRVAVMFGSANRDESRWERSEEFDITRADATRHLGFGIGEHSCVGQGLAQLEMQSLLRAMLTRVDRIETGEPERRLNQTMRSLEHLPARFTARGA